MRRPIQALLLSATLVVSLTQLIPMPSYATHTGTAGHVGGFEIDGDFAFPRTPAIPGATRDWGSLPAGDVSVGFDKFNDDTDDVFKGGSKEQVPDGWDLENGPKPPGKDDLIRFYASGEVTATKAYVFVGFERLAVEGNGDAHANFEFNQKTTKIRNAVGELVPERSPNDLLVLYDYPGGGKAAEVSVLRWSGTALAGSWVAGSVPAGAALADVNATTITRPAAAPFGGGTVEAFRFGEAALDLSAIFGAGYPGCPGFGQVWAKTRASGESIQSELKDVGMPVPIDLSRCPDVTIHKSASTSVVDAGDTFTYTLDGRNDGIQAALGVVVTDDLPDALTDVAATFDVDPNSAGGTGPCAVGPGNVVTCAVGTLAASDGNTTGPEPDTVRVSIGVRATAAACGLLRNVAQIAATNELQADKTNNTSNEVLVEVRCADIEIEKRADASAVSAGQPVGFLITVRNDGAGTAHDVTVTDTLPVAPGLNWTVDGGTARNQCSIAGGVLTCALGSMAGGASATIHLSSPTTPQSCGTIANTASVSTSNDGSGTASASTIVNCPDVRVRKSTSTPVISAGDTASYAVIVDNIGAGTAFGVSVSDALPAGLAWSVDPAVPGCGVAGGALSCTFAALAPGSSVTIVLRAVTGADDCGTLSNSATVSASNEPASASGNNSAGPVTITVNCARIDVTKTADAGAVSAGQPIGFEIRVTNNGDGEARGVVLTDSLPNVPGTSWSVDGGTASGLCSIAGGTLTCNLGSMAKGAVHTVHLTSPTTAASCGTVSNTASVTTTNDGSDQATASIIVACPDIRISKAPHDPVVNASDQVGFTINVSNQGPGAAFGVTVRDALPAGFDWRLESPVAGCAIAAGVLDCSLGTLAAGGSVAINVIAASDAGDCGTHPNAATADATNDDPVSASASVEVRCAAPTIDKTADAGTVSAGQSIGFTLTVRNAGPGDAYGVVVTDLLPATPGTAWSVDGGTLGGLCSIAGGTLTCPVGTLGPGQSGTIHVSSPTTAASCAVIDNTARVTSTNSSGAQDSASVTVDCPDIRVSKTADAPSVSAGQRIGYTITVSNAGPGTAFGVTLEDPLPVGTGTGWVIDGGTLASSCTLAGRTLGCTIGTVLAGGGGTVHVSSPTTSQSCGTYDNLATLRADNDDPATATASTRVLCPGLTIVKTADDASVSAGDAIGFTITVSNGGPGTAFGVTLNDPLPTGAGLAWSVDGGTAAASCGIAAGTLTCSLGDMAKDAVATVHVSSPTTKDSCGTYSNTATVQATNHGPESATASTRVDCAAIELTKTADDDLIVAGEKAGYTVTVRNGGVGEARDVVLSDPLPAGTGLAWTIDGGTMASSCAIAGGTLTCTLPSLAAGASATVHVSSPTGGLSCGPLVNVAAVTTSNDGSAQATATIVVECPIGIDIVKSGPSLAHVGDTITYTMTVTTTTITPLANVTVSDPDCNAAPAFLLGDDGDALLEIGETWVYECERTIVASDPDPMPNTATAAGTHQNRSATDSDDHLVDLIHPAINIDKTVNPVSGNPGDPVVYTYVTTNTGDTTLFNVTVTDDKLGAIGTVASLAPKAKVTMTKQSTLGSTAGSLVNIGTATGVDVLKKRVTDTDPASVIVVLGVVLVPTGVGPVGWWIGLLLLLAGASLIVVARRRARS